MEIMSVEELAKRADEEEATRRTKAWVEDGFLMIKVNENYIYDIPIDRMQTAAQTLDWIHQVCVGKTWGREMAPDILDAIFYDVIPTKMWASKA